MRRVRATRARDRSLSIRALRVFVREDGNGFPLLILNGIGANVEMLTPVREALGTHSRVIAFDAPGTGRSSTPLLPLPMRGIAQVAHELLDRLGHARADVVGFSLGGCVAQELARLAPERVRRLALVSTACGWGSRLGDPAALALLATPFRHYSHSFAARTSRFYGERDRGVDARLREARHASPPSLLGYAYQLLAAATWSSLQWLHTLSQPTLVISGAHDRITLPSNGVQLARLIPDSRLHILPAEGHLALFDPRSAALPLLAQYLSASRLEDTTAWCSGLCISPRTVAACPQREVCG